MWRYVKSLEYPVNIKKKDLRMAKFLVTQYGGTFHNRDFKEGEVMDNYCINLKKRKNKPYCKIKNREITFSICNECNNKEYKKSDYKWKSPALTGQSNNSQISKNMQFQEKIPPKKVKMRIKSNKLANLEKKRKSVFTEDLEHCYLCGKKKNDLHEIYGGRNRINSIKFNLVLPLCRKCHSLNQNNPFFNDYWHRHGQLYWEEHIGSREEFIKVFRRNYLE